MPHGPESEEPGGYEQMVENLVLMITFKTLIWISIPLREMEGENNLRIHNRWFGRREP